MHPFGIRLIFLPGFGFVPDCQRHNDALSSELLCLADGCFPGCFPIHNQRSVVLNRNLDFLPGQCRHQLINHNGKSDGGRIFAEIS